MEQLSLVENPGDLEEIALKMSKVCRWSSVGDFRGLSEQRDNRTASGKNLAGEVSDVSLRGSRITLETSLHECL